MREIKFRAWDASCERMYDTVTAIEFGNNQTFVAVYGQTPYFWRAERQDGDNTELHQANAQDTVLMQYTGLKDKNGVEIYEGDIVRERQFGQGAHPWVGSIDMFNGFYWLTKLGKEGLSDNSQGFGGASYDPNMVEIIGNIHENPELLDPTPQKGKNNEQP